MKLGEIVKEYREKNGISIREFAKQIGCSYEYVRKIEQKDVDVSYKMFIKIALKMNYDIIDLLCMLGLIEKVEGDEDEKNS